MHVQVTLQSGRQSGLWCSVHFMVDELCKLRMHYAGLTHAVNGVGCGDTRCIQLWRSAHGRASERVVVLSSVHG